MKEEYKGFQIEINRVPDKQFDFGGFGWAFQIFKDNKLFFKVVIKATSGQDENDNVQSADKWGITKIMSMIDMDAFEKGKTYCYQWFSKSHHPKEVNCKISYGTVCNNINRSIKWVTTFRLLAQVVGENFKYLLLLTEFACAHCGNEHIVKRGDGIIFLQPVVEGLQRVQSGVDKTASELAIKRLMEEIVAIKAKRDEKVGGWYGSNYGWGVSSHFYVCHASLLLYLICFWE